MGTDADALVLYGYWRSSAAYRVRIGLNLKRLAWTHRAVHLAHGDQHQDAHARLNPMHAVPVLVHGDRVLRQSLAILEYLDEAGLGGEAAPGLLPTGPLARAKVRELAQLVACDIHPLNNLRVVQHLESAYAVAGEARAEWMRHWMTEGFRAFEALLADAPAGDFCHGDAPSLADACLIPQLYNAHRFKLDLSPFPRIRCIEAACMALPAFESARPENQPDASP